MDENDALRVPVLFQLGRDLVRQGERERASGGKHLVREGLSLRARDGVHGDFERLPGRYLQHFCQYRVGGETTVNDMSRSELGQERSVAKGRGSDDRAEAGKLGKLDGCRTGC